MELIIALAICAATLFWARASAGPDRREIRHMLERDDAERGDDDAFIDD